MHPRGARRHYAISFLASIAARARSLEKGFSEFDRGGTAEIPYPKFTGIAD